MVERVTTHLLLVLKAMEQLSAEGEAIYGYQITERSGVHKVTVYRILNRLETEGLISYTEKSIKIARHRNGPPRRYIHFTAKGEQFLQKLAPRLQNTQLD